MRNFVRLTILDKFSPPFFKSNCYSSVKLELFQKFRFFSSKPKILTEKAIIIKINLSLDFSPLHKYRKWASKIGFYSAFTIHNSFISDNEKNSDKIASFDFEVNFFDTCNKSNHFNSQFDFFSSFSDVIEMLKFLFVILVSVTSIIPQCDGNCIWRKVCSSTGMLFTGCHLKCTHWYHTSGPRKKWYHTTV